MAWIRDPGFNQCCGAGAAGAATFRAAQSRSRFFCWLEPGAKAALFKAAPAASFRQAKKKSLVLVSKMTLRAVQKGKYGPKQTCINNKLFESLK